MSVGIADAPRWVQRRGDRELVSGRVEDVKVALAPVGVARRKLRLEPALERQRIHRVDVADVEDAAAPWLARCRVLTRRLRVQIDVERVQVQVSASKRRPVCAGLPQGTPGAKTESPQQPLVTAVTVRVRMGFSSNSQEIVNPQLRDSQSPARCSLVRLSVMRRLRRWLWL